MKPEPDTPNFEDALRQVLQVSKAELNRREAEYQQERAQHPKRGPKPKTSASDRVSSDKD
jgi:hypothetical protein